MPQGECPVGEWKAHEGALNAHGVLMARYRANFSEIRAARDAMNIKQERLRVLCGFEHKKIIQDMESELQFKRGRKFEHEWLSCVETALKMPTGTAFYDLAPPKNVPWVAWQQSNLNELAAVGKSMGEHLQNAGEMVGWASFLPCSFETPDFSDAHEWRSL